MITVTDIQQIQINDIIKHTYADGDWFMYEIFEMRGGNPRGHLIAMYWPGHEMIKECYWIVSQMSIERYTITILNRKP